MAKSCKEKLVIRLLLEKAGYMGLEVPKPLTLDTKLTGYGWGSFLVNELQITSADLTPTTTVRKLARLIPDERVGMEWPLSKKK